MVVPGSAADPARASELATEIVAQQAKVAEARREADRYSGGLVQALSESTFATAKNTQAMLEQQYFMAKYGFALPSPSGQAPASPTTVRSQTDPPTALSAQSTAQAIQPAAKECVKVSTFDSSVLDSNNTFVELAWKVDLANSCDEAFGVRVRFAIYDANEFELDDDSEVVLVPAQGVGKARGKMLVSPPEKARRMAKQGVSISTQ